VACLCTGVIFIAFQCNLIFCFCLSGGCSAFSVGDIMEMDVEISKFPEFSMVESGPTGLGSFPLPSFVSSRK